ncbi:MAG: flagellar biosynthetic protein FliR [Deltaproteobacteria bacterium]|nr:flagellar biosynthetic protein FliR [Deltaproteobacteria bacterium]
MQTFLEQLGVNIDLYADLIGWGLIFTRVLTMLILTPFLGGRGIPGRIRLLTAMILTTYVFYFMREDLLSQVPTDKGLIIVLFLKEIFIGFAIGLTTIMCFYAIEAGGRIVDNQRGSANAQIFLPALGQVSIFGLFQFWVGLSFFCAISGHVIFLKAFLDSFATIPVFSLPSIEPGISPFAQLIIRMSADVLLLGMQLAAPVLIGIFLTDLVLGIANKMAPQIPVFEIGFMMKGYVGILMVYVSIVVLVSQMNEFYGVMNTNVRRVVMFFAD